MVFFMDNKRIVLPIFCKNINTVDGALNKKFSNIEFRSPELIYEAFKAAYDIIQAIEQHGAEKVLYKIDNNIAITGQQFIATFKKRLQDELSYIAGIISIEKNLPDFLQNRQSMSNIDFFNRIVYYSMITKNSNKEQYKFFEIKQFFDAVINHLGGIDEIIVPQMIEVLNTEAGRDLSNAMNNLTYEQVQSLSQRLNEFNN